MSANVVEPQNLSILIVEDERDTADSTARVLSLYGFTAQIARDGGSALTAADTFFPDVVLLDIRMPKLDGYEVAKRLKDQSRGKRPIIVAVTGEGMDSDRLLSAGFDLHLVKPVKPIVLVEVLKRIAASVDQACEV